MTPIDGVGAVVLAGGRSARFGRDKLAEPIDGRPMLDHAIDAVRQVASDVAVVGAPDGPTVDLAPDATVVTDATAYEGPLAGLATGLRALQTSVERVIVVGGDMPTLVPAVLTRLLRQLDDHELAVLADEERPRPLPMAIERAAGLAAVERILARDERRLRALLEDLDVAVIPPATWQADDPAGDTLRDVDLPEDLPG
jgi:molybdenum cofactor guanylyltransferase